MKKYKVSVEWQGNNSTEDYFENEEEARNYGFEELADGCGEVIVDVEEIEDEEDCEEENDNEK